MATLRVQVAYAGGAIKVQVCDAFEETNEKQTVDTSRRLETSRVPGDSQGPHKPHCGGKGMTTNFTNIGKRCGLKQAITAEEFKREGLPAQNAQTASAECLAPTA